VKKPIILFVLVFFLVDSLSWALPKSATPFSLDDQTFLQHLNSKPVDFFKAENMFIRSPAKDSFVYRFASLVIDLVDLRKFDTYIKPTEQSVLKDYVKSRLAYFITHPKALYDLAKQLQAVKVESDALTRSLFPEFEPAQVKKENIPIQYGYLDTKPDAFRHAYVTARFCETLSSKHWGLAFMAAHEMDRNNNSGAAIAMDLHNNSIGARIYEELQHSENRVEKLKEKVLSVSYRFIDSYTPHTPEAEDYTPLAHSTIKQNEFDLASKQFELFENELVYIKSGPE